MPTGWRVDGRGWENTKTVQKQALPPYRGAAARWCNKPVRCRGARADMQDQEDVQLVHVKGLDLCEGGVAKDTMAVAKLYVSLGGKVCVYGICAFSLWTLALSFVLG